MEAKKTVPGYLIIDDDDGVFEGAVLVTDTRGIPLDFRYTDPVRPTRLERILYGSALDLYLREDVILKNLMEATEAQPTLWLVRDRDLLRAVQSRTKTPVAFLETSAAAPMESTGQLEPLSESCVYLLQADAISSPIRFGVAENKAQEARKIADALVSAAEGMEIMEPFGRMQKALSSLRDSDK